MLPRRAFLVLGPVGLVSLPLPRALAQSVPPATTPTVTPPSRLTVSLVAPHAGVVDGDFVVRLEATVSDPTVRTAALTVNGATYEVAVRDGSIEQQIVVVPGVNRVGVTVTRGSETARDSVTFFLRGERVELVVLLTWAARGEIIDLWTRDPTGETCKWDHRQTRAGGRLLDFSSSAIGFGSQAFVQPRVTAGRYRVKVHYWSEWAPEDSRDANTHQELITRLDALDTELATARAADRQRLTTEREDVLASLDRWATPAAPQTPVRAEAVLFPNSPYERRWRFEVLAQRAGQLVTLGEIEVDDGMIQAARRAGAR